MSSRKVNQSQFSESVNRLWELLDPCTLCPRECSLHRQTGQKGFCGTGILPLVSSVGPHFGEESVLVGRGGSGTIFFAGCNLGCVFCQNYDISHYRHGRETSLEHLAKAMMELQHLGCSNINLVTPTHVAPAIAAAIEASRKDGLELPIVYNCGGYESLETLRLLDGLIDIYMPDMKYADAQIAAELSAAPDYPEICFAAVREMHRQVGDLNIEQGLTTRGLLIRHLVLPANTAGSFEIIDFLAGEVSHSTAINVMDQYRPCFQASSHPEINRRPTRDEYESVRSYAAARNLRIID